MIPIDEVDDPGWVWTKNGGFVTSPSLKVRIHTATGAVMAEMNIGSK